ncbi:MAG: hypothetical protein K0Q95_1514 [Bacteroidota bacterium]|jgi:hypothetical protein|nr:hypothetical protein [Bacteroidota bacterium]
MEHLKLYMLLLGCKPKGRLTEQHDIFFGIAGSLKALTPEINSFWKEAKGIIHIDAWREVKVVNKYSIKIKSRPAKSNANKKPKLFFLNLGGYKPNEFEEHHYKMLVAANNSAEAIKKAKETVFYKETGFKGASSHIDDKYALDVDDVYNIEDILPSEVKAKFIIELKPLSKTEPVDEIHLGYLQLWKIKDNY